MQNTNSALQGYHPITRWLHAGLVLGVMFQISVATLMTHPEHKHSGDTQTHTATQALKENKANHHHDTPNAQVETNRVNIVGAHVKNGSDELGSLLMQGHRLGGLLVVVIVFLNLTWAVIRRGKPEKRQIDILFSKYHWCEAFSIAKNLPSMSIGKAPMVDSGNELALIFEMFGLLTMSAMAATGLVIWNLWEGLGSEVPPLAELFMQVHGAIAVVLFVYLVGHISMALLHMRSGTPVFSRILPCKKAKGLKQ